MTRYLLALDQGTTGSTAVLLDRDLQLVGAVNREFAQHYPQPGWVEHDPADIWRSLGEAVQGVLQKTGVLSCDIAAIGITNQRETTVVWDRATGQPVHRAIVWQCRRTADTCRSLREAGWQDLFRARTGLVLDPYFSGTKARWILDRTDQGLARARRGELAFGTIDTWMVWHLTGGAYVTDVSNASRTLMMDLARAEWDDELLDVLGVPRALLPAIVGNAEQVGVTRGVGFLPDGIPITGMAGDQQAALFGQACFEPGEAKCTYGTGAFLLMNTGTTPVPSTQGLLTTAAWRLPGQDTPTYALEGAAFIAGAAVQWLRDGLGMIETSRDIEALAAQVPDTDGVVFVPALTGLGAPHWNAEARGVLWGLTRGSTRAHIARAVLEGIAFQNMDLLQAMERDLGRRLRILRVDGGAAANNLLMQFQSDLLDVPISRPPSLESTATGAALLAGLGAGWFQNTDHIRDAWREERRFQPTMTREARDLHIARWRQGLARV
jgi:glycerol kinase